MKINRTKTDLKLKGFFGIEDDEGRILAEGVEYEKPDGTLFFDVAHVYDCDVDTWKKDFPEGAEVNVDAIDCPCQICSDSDFARYYREMH